MVGNALASVNGERFEERPLRLGERLTLGTAVVELALAPVVRKPLWRQELLVGMLLLGVLAGQVAAGWWLVTR